MKYFPLCIQSLTWMTAALWLLPAAGICAPPADSGRPDNTDMLVKSDRVLVIAHRGNSSIAPENTLPAFQSALETGADLVELDYRHSADGELVVFHDKDLDRTTDAVALLGREKVLLNSQSLTELQRLDAGAWFDPKFAETRIPTLGEALKVIQSGSVTLVERKDGDAAACVELLKGSKLLDQVVVQSFDWDYIRNCRRLAPNLVLAALGDKELDADKLAQLDQLEKLGVRVVGWNHKYLEAKQIQQLHQHGFRVWTYTVNDVDRAAELIDAGVDGLITDVPADMLKLVASGSDSTRQ